MRENDDGTLDPLDFAFLKDRYDYELVRKEQLTSALSLPVGLLGLLGSILAVMHRSFPFGWNAPSWVFGLLMFGAGACLLACLAQLARAYHRQEYHYLPLLGELDRKLNEWRSFYQDAGYEGAERAFFDDEMRVRIIDAADRNTENNDVRSMMLYWARLWLFWLLGFTMLAGMVFLTARAGAHV